MINLRLEQLGWNSSREDEFREFREHGLEPGRIAIEDKHQYLVVARAGEFSGHVSGKLLHEAQSPADLPKVGDWVALSLLANERKAVIHHVLSRKTQFSRKVPGRDTIEQILAANVDRVFLVQALDETFNPRLIERQLVRVHESGAAPVVVLNKTDLGEDLPHKLVEAINAADGAPVVTVSAKTSQGLDELMRLIQPGETIVFIGPSGVGKSSLINRLCGVEIQATTEVREGDSKGRHTTSWREMILLPHGGIVIDTPGLREFQIWLADLGILEAFSDIKSLGADCRFRDCTHTHETTCGVKQALDNGKIAPERYQNYLKLQRELAFLEEAQHQRASIDRKRQTKIAQRAFNKIKRRG